MQISRVLAIQSWGCAMTLGLGVSSSNSGENGPNSGGGGGGMAAGMMHAASGACLCCMLVLCFFLQSLSDSADTRHLAY